MTEHPVTQHYGHTATHDNSLINSSSHNVASDC